MYYYVIIFITRPPPRQNRCKGAAQLANQTTRMIKTRCVNGLYGFHIGSLLLVA